MCVMLCFCCSLLKSLARFYNGFQVYLIKYTKLDKLNIKQYSSFLCVKVNVPVMLSLYPFLCLVWSIFTVFLIFLYVMSLLHMFVSLG